MRQKMNDAKNIVKSPQDLIPIIKAAIALSSKSRVGRAYLKVKIFHLEFDANLEKFTSAGPWVLSAYLLNVMLTCYKHLKDYPVSGVEVLCGVGKDRHRIRTPMGILKPLYEQTEGRLDRITAPIVRSWTMDSVYKRT